VRGNPDYGMVEAAGVGYVAPDVLEQIARSGGPLWADATGRALLVEVCRNGLGRWRRAQGDSLVPAYLDANRGLASPFAIILTDDCTGTDGCRMEAAVYAVLDKALGVEAWIQDQYLNVQMTAYAEVYTGQSRLTGGWAWNAATEQVLLISTDGALVDSGCVLPQASTLSGYVPVKVTFDPAAGLYVSLFVNGVETDVSAVPTASAADTGLPAVKAGLSAVSLDAEEAAGYCGAYLLTTAEPTLPVT